MIVVVPLLFAGLATRVGTTTTTLRGIPNGSAESERGVGNNDHGRFVRPSRAASTTPPPTATTATTATTAAVAIGGARRTIHLISLPSTDDAYASPCESLLRECWRWKDATLGDGRDYFVPRPRALSDFHSLFVGMEIRVSSSSSSSTKGILDESEVKLTTPYDREAWSSEEDEDEAERPSVVHGVPSSNDEGSSSSSSGDGARFVVEECAALSNCARLDVVLVLRGDDDDDDDAAVGVGVGVGVRTDRPSSSRDRHLSAAAVAVPTIGDVAARFAVAYNLQRQVHSRLSTGESLLERVGLASWLDLPGAIRTGESPSSLTTSSSKSSSSEIRSLAGRLSSMEGTTSICTHLSLVASGMSPRPNRPDREVIFRPYSSRDAHILLQLKRTVEVVSVQEATEGGGKRGRIKTILDGALSAGKAARNDRVVPEIRKLREYGPDGTPPSALARIVAEAAKERAVDVSVAACVARLAAMETDTAERISRLRRRVYDVVVSFCHSKGDDDASLRKAANKLLHGPTMRLREGMLTGDDEIEEVFRTIEKELIGLSWSIER